MSPAPKPRSRTRRTAAAALWLATVALVVSACGAAFDPTGPCSADGSAPGAYPALEAAVPKTFRGGPPQELDSGRNCTATGLGTLAGHGVAEIRFAGGTWSTGTDSGLSLAVFADPGGPQLDPAWVAEFYEAGANLGKNVTQVTHSDYPVASGVVGRRIDVLNGESFQTVVVWSHAGQIEVALIADFIREIQTKDAHDKVVREAVDAFGG